MTSRGSPARAVRSSARTIIARGYYERPRGVCDPWRRIRCGRSLHIPERPETLDRRGVRPIRIGAPLGGRRYLARPDERVTPQIEELVRIELKGLSAEHQLRLLQARFGVIDGVRQVCADLLPRAGGNPFFLLEMVDALLERGRFEIHERDGGGQELVSVERPGEVALPLPSTRTIFSICATASRCSAWTITAVSSLACCRYSRIRKP